MFQLVAKENTLDLSKIIQTQLMKQKYILFIVFALISFKGISQANYSVTAIPFQPFSGTLTPTITDDDKYSPVINLPFSFDFYGNTYNQIVVGTNGNINFTTALAGQVCPWSFSVTIPNTQFPVKNSILGCFEDLNNPTGGNGTITYGTYGTAPFRKFVVYFNNQPHFSCGNTAISSSQMIISEGSNTIDVQVISRQPCNSWNAGLGVIGLINDAGTMGIAAPGRNTGNWTASQEAWRFYRPGYYPNYSFVRCDDNTDGFQTFDLSVAVVDLFLGAPGVTFHETMIDAQTQTNTIVNTTSYMNISNPQTIYVNNNGIIKPIVLSVIDCTIDADADSVPTATEDVNNDTNLANDDTDFDGIPNYLDNDDDGDLVLTNVEYVFSKTNSQSVNAFLDTDNDGILNYLDNDDDGDGLLTWKEDYNHDGNPSNDDTNSNGTPDYLESAVALGVTPVALDTKTIQLFPNPARDILNIQNNADDTNASIEIYTVSGARVKSLKTTEQLTSISVADLQTGVYFVKVTMNNQVGNYKFIKN